MTLAKSEAFVEIQAGLYEVRLGSFDKPIWVPQGRKFMLVHKCGRLLG
jgi:hypothetical protein